MWLACWSEYRVNQSYSWSVTSDCCSIPSLAIVGAHDEVCAIWVSCPLVVKLRIAVPICTKGDNYSLRGLRETHVLPMRKRRADKPTGSTILTDIIQTWGSSNTPLADDTRRLLNTYRTSSMLYWVPCLIGLERLFMLSEELHITTSSNVQLMCDGLGYMRSFWTYGNVAKMVVA